MTLLEALKAMENDKMVRKKGTPQNYYYDDDGELSYINTMYGDKGKNISILVHTSMELENDDWELVPQELLNSYEKEYLASFLKPFKDSVTGIKKAYCDDTHDYACLIINCVAKGYAGLISTKLPPFKKDRYYNGLALNNWYTPEELRLYE